VNRQPPSTISIAKLESSPAGPLWIAVTDQGLFAIEFEKPEEDFIEVLKRRAPQAVTQFDQTRCKLVIQQLQEYFEGKRQAFDISIDLSGFPAFQQAALRATLAIPYGQTATYAEIAMAIGHPGSARAVGGAEASNPIPIVIPCHRVVGSDGKLHGYGGPGGISLKAKLLDLERSSR
jgi:methylated-DNA-[protein]-cysteine S-methyltransferase